MTETPRPPVEWTKDEVLDFTRNVMLEINRNYNGCSLAEKPGLLAFGPIERLVLEISRLSAALQEARAKAKHFEYLANDYLNERQAARAERDNLRTALVGLVGGSTREELEQIEVGLRLIPAPAEDRASSIDAVHALLRTLPEEPQR